jgi:hypothetical protein
LLCFQIAIFSAISVASLASLQNLAGFQSSLANTPLNLTMSSTQHQSSSQPHQTTMPQLILASGQLVQGIQGAQLLIPTSQGTFFFGILPNFQVCDYFFTFRRFGDTNHSGDSSESVIEQSSHPLISQ